MTSVYITTSHPTFLSYAFHLQHLEYLDYRAQQQHHIFASLFRICFSVRVSVGVDGSPLPLCLKVYMRHCDVKMIEGRDREICLS